MRITLTADGRADAAEVWERYADPTRWPAWSPQVRHVSTAERIRPGLRGRVDGVLPFVVLDVDERARTWSWVCGLRPLRLHLEHAVLDHPDGVRTTLLIAGPAALVLPYLPVARLALERLVS